VSGKVRWRGARFIPLSLVGDLLAGRPLDESAWRVDGPGQSLVPAAGGGVFRTVLRWSTAVDRLHGATTAHSAACLEFLSGAGLWALVSYAGEAARDEWDGRIRAAFRLLADSGFGGRRALGWGRAAQPEFREGSLPGMILGFDTLEPAAWWLLSVFSPAPGEPLNWGAGNYATVLRGGRIESPVRYGDRKKQLPMIVEGSVLAGSAPPRGAAPDVAPDGFPHPVYRSGFAVAIPIPAQVAP
jgi:CRISPR type III-A-associated RAMP protein Csm4